MADNIADVAKDGSTKKLTDPASPTAQFISLLGDYDFTIPVEANFFIDFSFDKYPELLNLISQIDSSSIDSAIEPNSYGVQRAQQSLNNLMQRYKENHFIFAQDVTIPGENVAIKKLGVSDNNVAGVFLPLPTLNNRAVQNTVKLSILETNTSFLDSIVRPWIICTSLYGLYSRTANSKQNIKLPFFQVIQLDNSNQYRKVITFNNAVPVSMGSSRLSYGTNGSTQTKIIETEWLFSDYSISIDT
jgi:hypothetical protein